MAKTRGEPLAKIRGEERVQFAGPGIRHRRTGHDAFRVGTLLTANFHVELLSLS